MTSYDEDVECWSAGVPGAWNLEVAKAEGGILDGWIDVHVDEDVMMFMMMRSSSAGGLSQKNRNVAMKNSSAAA